MGKGSVPQQDPAVAQVGQPLNGAHRSTRVPLRVQLAVDLAGSIDAQVLLTHVGYEG